MQVIKSARVMKKAVAHLIPFMEVEQSHLLSTYLLKYSLTHFSLA